MLLEQATSKTVSRVLSEINGFDWEGDFKPMARQALMVLLQKRLDQEMTDFLECHATSMPAIGTTKWSLYQTPVD
jgi:hypothetical protein